MRYALVVVAVLGCGDGSHGALPDGSLTDAGGDGIVDAPADAAVPASSLEISSAGLPATSYAFATTAVGQRASATFVVRNTATVPTTALAVTSSTSELAIDDAARPCAGAILAPGDDCLIAVTYRPTAATDLHASLAITGAATATEFPVTGHAVTSSGLVTDVAVLDFGLVETDATTNRDVLVENLGTTPITLGTLTATGGFGVSTQNCPPVLTAGGACTATLSFNSATARAASGVFTITSDANDVTVPLSALVARRVSVVISGGGSGEVSATPAGLVCDAGTCSGLFLGAVTLTAQPAIDSLLGTWSGNDVLTCVSSPTCDVPGTTSTSVSARFELVGVAKAVAIDLAGPGRMRVVVEDTGTGESEICIAPCTIYYAPGASVSLGASTPEVFTGWTGACIGTDINCSLGTIINDRATTARADLDDREVRTLLPAMHTDVIAYASDGDLLVAGAGLVSRLAPTGEVRWSRTLDAAAGVAYGVAAASDGDVLQLQAASTTFPTTLQLTRLTSTGTIRWTRSFASAAPCSVIDGGNLLAASNGDVAVAMVQSGVNTISVFDAANQPRWSLTDLASCVAAAAPGGYRVLARDVDNHATFARYDLDGTRGADQGPILPAGDLLPRYAVAVDAAGNIAVHASASSSVTISEVTATGTGSFGHTTSTPCCGLDVGVAFDSGGNLLALRDHSFDLVEPGFELEQWSPAGTSLWTLVKPGTSSFQGVVSSVFQVRSIASDGSGHISVAGDFSGLPWIETFAMP